MKINGSIAPSILAAANGLLQPFVPELSPSTLLEALKLYGAETHVRNEISKPLTRKEAAELLSVSMPTLNRMLNAGKLRRIRLSSQAVRVDPASIQTLLQQSAVRV